MQRRNWRPSVVVIFWAAIVVAIAYAVFRLVDPLPPRRFAIAAGIPGTTYDDIARQYARILARDGITLEVRNYPSAIENVAALRDETSGVQAALSTFWFTQPDDAKFLYSLGGISDTAIFILYKNGQPITRFAELRGKRISIGAPSSALRSLMLDVLRAAGAMGNSIQLSDLEYDEAVAALISGDLDLVMFPSRIDDILVERALAAPDVRLMNVAQAEAIAKTFPGLKHVVLWRGLISLTDDVPANDVDMLALRNRLLVRQDLHPALQYLLLGAMREVHGAPGPFNRLSEYPSEQADDLPLSPTAQAFYRSGSTLWQKYTSFWLSSLLNRIVFFVIPVIAVLIPLIGFAPRIYRWASGRPIARLHRALGNLERELEESTDAARVAEYELRVSEVESAVRSLKVARSLEADLQRLRIHLRMVRERLHDVTSSGTSTDDESLSARRS